MDIVIRKASKSDLDNLLKWGKALHQVENYYEPHLKFSESESKKKYTAGLKDSRSLFLIAELDGKSVGYLYAYLQSSPKYLKGDQQSCELEVIFIEEKTRGKAIASQLVNDCVKWANDNRADYISAGVYARNKLSLKLLSNKGFDDYHVTLRLSLK